MSDDFTGEYLNSRGQAATALDELLASQPPQDEPVVTAEKAGSIAGDVALGIVEAPRQVIGGVMDATKELAQFMESVVPLGTVGGDEVTEESFITTDEPRTTTGGLIRGVSQFVTGFLPATKAIKAAGVTGKLATAAGAGALTDAFAFDPHEDRLSNLIQENEALANPVTEFLAAEPDDSDAEGRFKNALEGLGLGLALDGFVKSVKVLRANRIEKREARQLLADKEQAKKLAQTGTDLQVVDDALEGEFIPFEEKAAQESVEFGAGAGKAADDAAANINLNNIDSTEQVDNLIKNVAEQDAPKINEARREAITLEETEKLADDLGLTVEQLLDRRKGEAFNAEQAVAARKIMVASGENLFKLSKKAATGSDEDVAIFARALAQHRAIQAQVSGLTAEAGRALSSFRIQAKSAEAQTRAINEALQAGGGSEHIKYVASMVSQLDEVGQLNSMLSKGATGPQMVYEAWINGLLSSPTTHAVNALSNALVAGWSVGERKVASMISTGLGNNSINEGEVIGQLFGIVQGGKDGMKLAWKALKTGDPSDPLQKVEQQEFKRITAENLGLTGVPGRFADYFGEFVRMPGRFLTAGDELFKTMGYRMELNAQAFRTAKNEGLEGEALAKRIQSIINDPPENLHLEAVDASRYQTFTKDLGKRGKSIEKVLQVNPEARIIVPFLRTPTNIIKWVGERTPLAPLNSAIRAEIMAGGARQDMALAKIATGSMAMAMAADYFISGNITGGGPKNPQMRSLKMATGWQPYSIKVGDNYYAYSRLDPIGAFVGLSADTAEIMGQTTEADTMDLTLSAVTATAQNVTSKTYLSGVAEFFDMMSGISADPESANKQAKRWVERLAGSAVPSGVAQIERIVSPELSATQGILEKIQSRIPGYSDDLPPRRNIFGEPIVLSGGLGPDIMSPIYTSEDKNDPIADEIVKQGTLLRMPMKNIQGVELTTEQYDDYVLFYSGQDNQSMNYQPLKERLQEEMNSSLYMGGSDGPEGLKSEIITRIFAAYKNSAKAEMLKKYPEIKNEIDRLKIEKAAKLQGL